MIKKAIINSFPLILLVTIVTVLVYFIDPNKSLSILVPWSIFIVTIIKKQMDLEKLKETRFLGFYPDYFDEVIKILGEAKHSISITTPVLATGYKTANSTWKKYRTTLNHKEEVGVKINFVCYDKSRRIEYSLEKFGEESLKGEEEITENKDLRSSSKDKNTFSYLFKILNVLEAAHVEAQEVHFKDLEIHQTNQPIGLYSWVVDYPKNPRAVFVIPSNIRSNAENAEVAFFTKDFQLIKALIEISTRLAVNDVSSNIRPLNSIVYEGADYIQQTAIDFVNESGVIYSLGTIDALVDTVNTPYLNATKKSIIEDTNQYFRVGNFSLTVGKVDELHKLKNNISFFLNLLELGVKNTEIYHNSDVAKGVDDFHFRINQNKVVIRVGAKTTKNITAIAIPDKRVREIFLTHYKNTLASQSSKLLTTERLQKLRDITTFLSPTEISKNIGDVSLELNDYLETLPTRLSFNNGLLKEDLLIDISDITNLSASEFFDLLKIYNRYGVAILSLKNSKKLERYREEKDGIGLRLLDEDMKSLSRFFGAPYVHERSNKYRVDIKYGGNKNSPYMGTTNEPYPPHSDGIYDNIPPQVVCLFSYQPCKKETGQTTLISGKAIFDRLNSSLKTDEIQTLFKTKIEFEREGKQARKPIFELHNSIYINYRNDRKVKIENTDNPEIFSAVQMVDQFVSEPTNTLSIFLEEGQLLIMDNRAILHGRTEFEDSGRWLCRYSFIGGEHYNQSFISGFSSQPDY